MSISRARLSQNTAAIRNRSDRPTIADRYRGSSSSARLSVLALGGGGGLLNLALDVLLALAESDKRLAL